MDARISLWQFFQGVQAWTHPRYHTIYLFKYPILGYSSSRVSITWTDPGHKFVNLPYLSRYSSLDALDCRISTCPIGPPKAIGLILAYVFPGSPNLEVAWALEQLIAQLRPGSTKLDIDWIVYYPFSPRQSTTGYSLLIGVSSCPGMHLTGLFPCQ